MHGTNRYAYLAVIALVAAGAAWPGHARAQAGHGGHQAAPRAQQPISPYAGQEGREIKALDAAEVKDLLEGRGLGLARAAELNHYPGPLHVLQFARQLSLSAEQERATRALFQQMQADAVRRGRAIVEKERELDRAFAEGQIDRRRLERLVSEIARLQGELRVVHLATHLAMKELLTPEQVRRYDEVRGYTASSGQAPSPAEAGIRVELVAPRAPQAGRPASLVYRLTDARTGQAVTDVVESHERLVHLIAVSQDLQEFQHVHPRPNGRPGEFAIDLTLPSPGSYRLFSEFTRLSGQSVLQRDELDAGRAASGSRRPALAEDRTPKVRGGVRVTLEAAETLPTGRESQLSFRIEDARTGEGLRDLSPYLGAPAHVVILSADAQSFAHTHGEAGGVGEAGHGAQEASPTGHGTHGVAGAARSRAAGTTVYGPEIGFRHVFGRAGLYKIWGEFQTADGEVVVADFVVRAR